MTFRLSPAERALSLSISQTSDPQYHKALWVMPYAARTNPPPNFVDGLTRYALTF
jgi:hypothetical protein